MDTNSNQIYNYLCNLSKFIIHLILCIAFLAACTSNNHLSDDMILPINDKYFKGHTQFSFTSNGFRLSLFDSHGNKLDQTIFNYEPYQLDIADVDRDGRTDILIGLIKTTEFDPE